MRGKLFMLSVLYFVQGLPYGFQAIALPTYLRAEGLSLTAIGFAGALSLPWVFKVVWGPAVDRYGSRRFGRRRSWIVPLQIALAAACAAAAFIPPSAGLGILLATVFAMNLFASTMDVAVDGLAVDVLKPEQLGYGNIAQVVGYKVGILTGGGLLVWASGRIGWQGLFLAMAALVVLALMVTLSFRERPRKEVRADDLSQDDPSRGEPTSMAAIVQVLVGALRRPGTAWLLLFIATYKLGESMADAMFKPFLYDSGYTESQIGLWVGTWGMVFSLIGSFLGGVLASRMRIVYAVAIAASLRALAVGGEWWLSIVGPTTERVAGVITIETLFGGALTTAMFAYMMSRVDRRIGATHFTALATVEVFGKMVAGWTSGYVTDRLGYTAVFALATGLATVFLLLLVPMVRSENRERTVSSA